MFITGNWAINSCHEIFQNGTGNVDSISVLAYDISVYLDDQFKDILVQLKGSSWFRKHQLYDLFNEFEKTLTNIHVKQLKGLFFDKS